MKQTKKYFAFISYKRKDEEWAKWFQNELENYHLPSVLNGRPDIVNKLPEQFRPPKGFRPVFRDYDELIAGNLPEQIYNALKDSLNLVVICSPQLADDENAKWVNKEIADFIEIGKKEKVDNIRRIFPFIVDGFPHDKNGKECFPKLLREIPEAQERVGGNINEGGSVNEINRERAFVKVLAGMLPEGISMDMLWNKYDEAKKQRELKEKEERDKLMIAQSRFLAEKANLLIGKGDSYTASILALKALPARITYPDRPYVLEAEVALRKAIRANNAFLIGHRHSVTSLVFNCSGTRIYSVSYDKKLCVWDSKSGRLVASSQKHTQGINSVMLSKDDSMLVTASDDKKVIIWDTKTIRQKGKPIIHNTPVWYASFSPCCKYILTVLDDGNVCIWDLKGNLITRFEADINSKIAVVLMVDESRIIVSSWSNVKIWKWNRDTNNIVELCTLLNSSDVQKPMVTYCCKRNLIICAQGKNLSIWNLFDYELEIKIPFFSKITAIAIDEDESQIAVSCSNYLYLLKIPKDRYSWRESVNIAKFGNDVLHLSFNPRNKNILLLSFGNDIHHLRLLEYKKISRIKKTLLYADSIDFISNERVVITSSQDEYPGTIYCIKTKRRERIIQENVFEKDLKEYGLSYKDYDKIFYNKNNRKIYCLGDKGIYKYNIVDKTSTWYSLDLFSSYECCFKTISMNGKRAVYAFKDGTMFLVNVTTGKSLKVLEKTKYPTYVHSACFSSDSRYIATTSTEGQVRVYELKNKNSSVVFSQNTSSLLSFGGNSIEFSQKGDMIISASQDYYVYIWKRDEENKRFSLKSRLLGHEEKVCCASFSYDGQFALSASPSKIIVWDVVLGMPIEIMETTTKSEIKFIKFNPNSTQIYYSCEGILHIIDFPRIQELINITKKRFRLRKLSSLERKLYYLE